MTATNVSATEQMDRSNPANRGKRWTLLNVVAILTGLVIFWPVGLFFLVWILMNRELRELPGIIQAQFNRLRSWMSRQSICHQTDSGNRVFDEFQQTQHDRIDEIKIEIKDRDNAFREYKEEKDRAAEQSQFDEFMQKKPPTNGESVDD